MIFLERLDALCKEKGISKRKLEMEASLGHGIVSKWKKEGNLPNQQNLKKISDYLGVSTSYLLGESDFRSEREAVIDGWNKSFATNASNFR